MLNRYYCLSLLVGIVHKLYDDLYDNNLYSTLGISLENVDYLNEFLKCVFGLGYTVLSLQYLFFYVFFTIINVILYSIKKSDYGPYEFSGLLSSIILLPFLQWSPYTIEECAKDIVWLIITFAAGFGLEKICNRDKNAEYSSTKLQIRFSLLILLLCLLFVNQFYAFFSESVKIIMLFNIGYLLTSCAFQYFLINHECNKDADNEHSA